MNGAQSSGSRWLRVVGVAACLGVLAVSCSEGGGAEPASSVADDSTAELGVSTGAPDPLLAEQSKAVVIDVFLDRLPTTTGGVIVADLEALRSGFTEDQLDHLLAGRGSAPVVAEMIAAIGSISAHVDLSSATTAVLAYDADDGGDRVLLAALTTTAPEAVVNGDASGTAADGTPLFDAGNGRVATVMADGTLIVGSLVSVDAVLTSTNEERAGIGPLQTSVETAIGDGALEFVLGVPGLVDPTLVPHSLGGSSALSGRFDVDDGQIEGRLVLHSEEAEQYAATYNGLNRHAVGADGATETPAEFVAPDQVVVALPTFAVDATPDELIEIRHRAKKFFIGMEASAYAGRVPSSAAPWFDLVGTSEADGTDPPTPASVFFRWRFKDDAAIRAFEDNELPEGYRLAPTRFFDTDAPEGEYFFLLNLYNAGGGSIVGGARAEWDVYVYSPEGGPDPNPGERPRFFVVDALAEQVSFDPVNLVTPAEPLSHAIIDGQVTSTVATFDGEATRSVWQSSFPQPDPAVNDVARFTREMAIGNDYIYWGYGAADRVLYNGTTYNYDAFFIDPDDVAYVDNSRWADYLDPALVDVVYYDNSLEYVVSPLVNLASDQLDITPEWRQELLAFKSNGHQEGLMRKAVELLFRGQGDAMVGFDVINETPSAFAHVEITDPAGFAAAIDLPPAMTLAPIALLEGSPRRYYLTVSVYEIHGSTEGTRAEWSTYVDFGDGRPKQFIVQLQTEHLGIDPEMLVNLPSTVEHVLDGATLTTHLRSDGLSFVASLDTTDTEDVDLTMDWVESGDLVCYRGGVCDALFYDAETLDVPVKVARNPEFALETPWDTHLDTATLEMFFRPNFQEYAVKRWFNLDVPVDELPFSGIESATHTITGRGTLVGRTNGIVDSAYTYSGDARLDEGRLVFAMDQEISNSLGVGNIFTTGSFDLSTGTGTQTVVDCLGPALLCSDIVNGSTTIYTAGELDASGGAAITWRVDLAIVLGGAFGIADSESSFEATVD